MKNLNGSFMRYAMTLLIVSALLVTIGGLSVGRTTVESRKKLALDMSAKEKAEVISTQNSDLKRENAALKLQNQKLTQEKEQMTKKAETLENYMQLESFIKAGNTAEAKKCFEKIDEGLLPDVCKTAFETYKFKLFD